MKNSDRHLGRRIYSDPLQEHQNVKEFQKFRNYFDFKSRKKLAEVEFSSARSFQHFN